MKSIINFHHTGKKELGMMLLVSCFALFSCKKSYNAPPTPANIQFTGAFSGQAEIPSVNTSASGTLTASYNPTNKTLQYTFTWNNLSGVPVAMHFHDGATGTNGPVIIPISGFPAQQSGSVSGTSAPLNDNMVNDLMAGKFYGNIHTQNNPGGEVRAQVGKQ